MKVSIKKSKLDSQVKMSVFWNLMIEINLTPSIKIDTGSFCCISVHVQYVNSHEKHPTVMLYLSFKLSNMFPCQTLQISILTPALYGEAGFAWVERNVMVTFYVYEHRIFKCNNEWHSIQVKISFRLTKSKFQGKPEYCTLEILHRQHQQHVWLWNFFAGWGL